MTAYYLVNRDDLTRSFRERGFRLTDDVLYSFPVWNARQVLRIADPDDDLVIVVAACNDDGTWGWGRIIPPPSTKKLDI